MNHKLFSKDFTLVVIGLVIGGVLYSVYVLESLLWICILCFVLSAVMEIFIHIPYQKQNMEGSIRKMVMTDFAESIRFIRKEKPVIGKALLVVCGINLFLASMIIVAVPYLITEVLGLETAQANRLYGFAEGALAAGGLTGGICAGVFADKLAIRKAGNLIVACAVCISYGRGADALFLRNNKLYRYYSMLLYYHGVFDHFYRADDVLYTGANPGKSDWKGYRSYSYSFHVCTAVGKCALRFFI